MSEENRIRYRPGYAVVPRNMLDDDRLSIEARGLLALMMTMSDGWLFSREHLMKRTGVGKNKFTTMTRQLKDCGYLKVHREHNALGRFFMTWEIIPEPTVSSKTVSGKPRPLRLHNSKGEDPLIEE